MDFKVNFNTLIVLITLSGANCVGAKFYEPVCRDGSPECLKKSIQAALPSFFRGAPQYGLETLDPFRINNLVVDLAGGLKSRITEGYAKGLRKCVVDFAKMDGDTLETQIHCNLTIRGKYKSTGRLLIFSVNGDGDTVIRIRNLKIHNIMTLGSREEADGQKYFVMKSTSTDHSFDGRLIYHFTNLLKGNPEASKAVVDFANENWQLVADEFGSPFVEYGVSNVLRNIRRLFKEVSIDRLISGDF